jgi:hypothetical protein
MEITPPRPSLFPRQSRGAGLLGAVTMISLLHVGVPPEHRPVRVRRSLHQLEHDCVEENEACLLKQTAAELARCFDRRVKDAVRELRKRAVRLPRDQRDLRPSSFAVLAK